MPANSYGYGTCQGCGRRSPALKSGKPHGHSTLSTRYGPLSMWLCRGCDVPMDDIRPPCECGRAHVDRPALHGFLA
jgi:hypothetical protein